jgi:micrococcal nuclease
LFDHVEVKKLEAFPLKAQRIIVGLILSFLFSMLLGSQAYAQDDAQTETQPPRGIPREATLATVREVVDGDTLRVTLDDGTKATVRLIGIDTPETKDPDEPVGCFGPEASARMEHLLPIGRQIWLENDVTDSDRYDRLLRYVWVAKNDGDIYLLNEVMVRDGFALAIRYTPDTARAEQLEAAQDRAASRSVGLWGACSDVVSSLTPIPQPAAAQAPVVEQPVEQPPAQSCDPSYPSLCIAPGAADIDCPEIGAVDFTVYPPDPHGFDRDNDGVGCEN